ncbi:MAG: hypothetical protein ACNA8W_02180 [Bradymonadaceae bacterium]
MSKTELLKASPDSFVALIPVPWGMDGAALLEEVHGETWFEEARFELTVDEDEAEGIFAHGRVMLGEEKEVGIVVEAPIDELLGLASMSREPFSATELLILEKHQAIWRLVLPCQRDRCRRDARLFARLLSTFVEAGAAAVFLPFCLQMHSPRVIKHLTMDLGEHSNLVNLFVGAFNDEKWMRTRGLTALGLPELETVVDEGLNAAYFRLMDVAASIILQQGPFPVGSELQLGPRLYEITAGPNGPDDPQVPVAGTYGVHTIGPPSLTP